MAATHAAALSAAAEAQRSTAEASAQRPDARGREEPPRAPSRATTAWPAATEARGPRWPTTHRLFASSAQSRSAASARAAPSGLPEIAARGAPRSESRPRHLPPGARCAPARRAPRRGCSPWDRWLPPEARRSPAPTARRRCSPSPARAFSNRAPARRRPVLHRGATAQVHPPPSLGYSYQPQIPVAPEATTCIFTTRSRLLINFCTRSSASRSELSLIDASISTVSRSRMTRATSVIPRSWAAIR